MPTASISGTVLNVTGLTVGQQYAMMLYCLYPGNTSYTALVRQPESGTREAATTTWSFNISSLKSCSFGLSLSSGARSAHRPC